MNNGNYKSIVNHYENCFKKHGDNHKGLDWPNYLDLIKRYNIMLELIKQEDKSVTLLDFGCGTAGLKEYINSTKKWNKLNLNYSGLDLGSLYIQKCKEKFPLIPFYNIDILEDKGSIGVFDYIVMNGVFTEKQELSFDEMFSYFKRMIKVVYSIANKGIAFNVMSKSVDWEREDLFHLSLDLLSDFLVKNVSRNYIIRNDYGLYEYTVYLYK